MSKAVQGMRTTQSTTAPVRHLKPWDPGYGVDETNVEVGATDAEADEADEDAAHGIMPPATDEAAPVVRADVIVARLALDATPASKGAKPDDVVFVSATTETNRFDLILGVDDVVRGTYDASGERIIFRVPAALAARASRHHFIRTGRLVKVT